MTTNINLTDFISVFNDNIQYCIPKWQRRYSWNDLTIKELVKDLKAVAERRRRGENATHFGGTLITYSSPTPLGRSDVSNVVDGQQRLTTISILLVCIAEKLEETGGSVGAWNSENIRSVLLKNSLDPADKLRLQGTDNQEYQNILKGCPEGKGGGITAAWRVLQEAVGNHGPRILMEGLNHFEVISFPCQPSDDPQQIFQSLNATGVPLTEGEKVKNWLLMGVGDEKIQEEVYQDWCMMEFYLDSKSENLKRTDEFLWNFFRWRSGKNVGIKNTYSNLRRWWYEKKHPTDRFCDASNCDDRRFLCEELARLSGLYGTITGVHGQHSNDEVNNLLRHLRGLRIDVHRPLTLRYLDDATRPDETGAREEELIRVLEALSAWLTRSWVSGKPMAGLNTAIIGLAHSEGPLASEPYADYWIKEIQKFRNTRISVPNEEEIREGIKKRKGYRGKASDAAKTVLWTISSKLGYHADPEIESLSIEHIMPRTLSEEWKEYLGPDFKEVAKIYTDTLANLTLVGEKINSQISNRIYSEKRNLYKDSGFRLTRELVESYDEWRREDMDRRANELATLILEFWPWEGVTRAKARWRIGEGDWREEKVYTGMLLSVIRELLDIDQKRNSEKLLGNRASKDIFHSGTEPASRGRRYQEIPGHSQYVMNLSHNAVGIANICMEMGQRCEAEVDVCFLKERDGEQVWENVLFTRSLIGGDSQPRWRIGDNNWNEEKFYRDVLLSVVSALLKMDPTRNGRVLLGNRPSKDIFRTGTYSGSRGRSFKEVPDYPQYMVNVHHSADYIRVLCTEMGERCGIKVDVE